MAPSILHNVVWALVRSQHGVVARWQLLKLGFTHEAIRWRIARGRLHPIHRGVYAVGRPVLSREGHWIAAVLACGPKAWLSFQSAAQNFRMIKLHPALVKPPVPIDVSLHAAVFRHPAGIRIHRTTTLAESDLTVHNGIPTATPTRTLIDLATILSQERLEAAVNEANAENLIEPESLRQELDHRKGQPGVKPLRTLLDRHTFRMTESEARAAFPSHSSPGWPTAPRDPAADRRTSRLPLARLRPRRRGRRLALSPHACAPGPR